MSHMSHPFPLRTGRFRAVPASPCDMDATLQPDLSCSQVPAGPRPNGPIEPFRSTARPMGIASRRASVMRDRVAELYEGFQAALWVGLAALIIAAVSPFILW